MAKRPLAVPTSRISRADFMALQARWDRKLARAGFKDIESGQDLNLLATSTFRGVSNHATGSDGHGAEFVLGIPAHVADQVPNVFSTARARAWALFSQAAHDLPRDARTRLLLVDVATCGNQAEVARRRKIAPERLSELVRRLCSAIGVDSKNLFGSITEPGEFSELGRAGNVTTLSNGRVPIRIPTS